jgi:osmotically-inducible protein OsmY
LTGTLKSYHMKQLAFSLTSKVPGVNQVIDELIVDRSTTEALSEALSPAEG